MATGYFITHPDVIIDPEKPIERWGLSARGRERMRTLLEQPWQRSVGAVLCSSEQKALDGAEILVAALSVPQYIVHELGEYDRSSTGLLPPAEFWSLVEQFFAQPEQSIRGWERAVDALRPPALKSPTTKGQTASPQTASPGMRSPVGRGPRPARGLRMRPCGRFRCRDSNSDSGIQSPLSYP